MEISVSINCMVPTGRRRMECRMAKKVPVLLIDDSRHQHELFKCYVSKSATIELHVASTLEEGIQEVERLNPDIVFLDSRLHPFRSYIETAPLIRASGYTGKIIVISTDVTDGVFLKFRDYSVACCIDKFAFNLSNCETMINKLAA